MLLRTTDPFRDFDRLASQVLGTTNRPAVMPMDAWRQGDVFQIEFDLPGVSPSRSTWTSSATSSPCEPSGSAATATGRCSPRSVPRGVFSRQLVLGDNLDLDRIEARCDSGVLRLSIPVAERAKPRKIEVSSSADERTAIEA